MDRYDYEVPRELIAQKPLARRSDARLLVVRRAAAALEHSHVRNLTELLRPNDCVVLNDTRVIPARLVGYRTNTGGRWSGLFLSADDARAWKLLSKTRGKLKVGESVTLVDHEGRDACRLGMLAHLEAGVWMARAATDEPAMALLERIGRVPLPPYIRDGEMIEADREAYQTVYAERPGAVAAPTAGLHFTPELLQRLQAMGVHVRRVTLHVGLGTFRPISVRRLEEHQMHAEWAQVTPETAADLRRFRADGGRILAVGTTVVRTLETAAQNGTLGAWQGATDLFIRPPYRFQAVDGLLTNFHWPKSTLLVLVSAFAGHALIQRAYAEAIRERYRLFSYGDAMLIL